MYRFKRWQWVLIRIFLPIYFTLATFKVFGGFYIAFTSVTRR